MTSCGVSGAVVAGPAAAFSLSGPEPVFAATVSGGGLLCAVHRYALARGALPGVRPAQRRDVSAAAGGVVAARTLGQAIVVLQEQLAAGKLDWSRVIVDASLVDAKKGARRSRARSGASRQPFPPGRRRKRAPARSPARGRQRKRAAPPAAADRPTRGTRPRPCRAVGRPRLRRQAARRAPRARDRTADQQTAAPATRSHPAPQPGCLARQRNASRPPTRKPVTAGLSNAQTPG